MAETPATTSRGRLPSLTGMRFFAALLVFLAHVAQSSLFADPDLARPVAENFTQLGWVGVSFFFVLSGFVLTWTSRDDDRPGLFIRRRLAKIYPNHLVTWVVASVIVLATGVASVSTLLPSLVLAQAWIPIQTIAFVPNDPSWSLCAELLFYLAFPWLLTRLRRVPGRALVPLAGAMVALAVLIPLIAELLPAGPVMAYYDGPTCALDPCTGFSWWEYWSVFLLPVSRLPEFMLGMITAELVASDRLRRVNLPAAGLTVLAGYGLALVLPGGWGMVWPTLVPLALVVAAGARHDLGGTRSPLSGWAMLRLGEISFAFYLVHFMVLRHGPVGDGPRSTGTALALVAASLVVSLALAWVLYRCVEQPAVRRWSTPRAVRSGNTPQTTTDPSAARSAR